jgi:hypothetical protein
MARLFPLLAMLVLHSFAAEARDVNYQGDLAPLNITPTFDKGYLAVYETLETISLYGPDGALAYKATAHVPGASWLDVENAAPDSDGTLVVTLEYRVSNVRGGGLAVFDRAGTQTAFIDTGSDWWPTHACIGPGHTIWTIGWRGLNGHKSPEEDYFVLRNYSRDGRLLGTFLPRSSFEQDPVGPIVGGWVLRSANGRVGGMFYVHSVLPAGQPRKTGQWIEVDLHGSVVRRVELPRKQIFAFGGSGSLYAFEYDGGYSVFDPTSNTWRIITGIPAGVLLGADGDSLVFKIRGSNTLVWEPVQ